MEKKSEKKWFEKYFIYNAYYIKYKSLLGNYCI